MVPRIKIAAAILGSYLLSAILMRYVTFGEKPYVSTEKMAVEVKQMGTALRANIAGFAAGMGQLSASRITAGRITPTPLPLAQNPAPPPAAAGSSSSMVFENLPTSAPPPVNYPTAAPAIPTAPPALPTTPPSIPTQPPAKPPAPTKKPDPPKPTTPPELPPITTDRRPGNSVDEILADVQKRMCVPAALMKAIQSEETGSRFLTFAGQKFEMLNTYGWWNRTDISKNDLFLAAAYSAQSGNAPSDGRFANEHIAKAIQPGAYDQMIMGMLQVSQQEQDASFKNTSKVITAGKIDRRVIYDNALIFASVTKNKVGNLAETGCGDWSFKAVARAACKHLGGCNYNYGANNGNYCTKICNHYNDFAGTKYDCNSAASLMENNGDDGKCTLK